MRASKPLPPPVTVVRRDEVTSWSALSPWRSLDDGQLSSLTTPTLDLFLDPEPSPALESAFSRQPSPALSSPTDFGSSQPSPYGQCFGLANPHHIESTRGSYSVLDTREPYARPGRVSWPVLPAPTDPARKLTRGKLWFQRGVFVAIVVFINAGLATFTLLTNIKYTTLALALAFKFQDCLMSLIALICFLWTSVARLFRKPKPASRQWVLSLLPAYNESEEQIIRACRALKDSISHPHAQVVTIVLDGHHKDLHAEFSRIVAEFGRPSHSLKHRAGTLKITAGFMFDDALPVIIIEKVKNSGKKDSLVLAHDLFNYPRDNMPEYTRLLRKEIWGWVLPALTKGTDFSSFDMIFCTDADSLIHDGCIMDLIEGLATDSRAIAACGLVFVEFEQGYEWSFWNFFQLTQYAYGQFVRRWAESFVGKVTCLPGCATMIAVRPEMAGAIADYARPVKEQCVVHHQVQNLGTDRRLTYCMLSQNKRLRTIFVPGAISETVAPQSFKHYLHQRRRWGSNAYFNNLFYFGGRNQVIFTRTIALFHLIRQTAIYYRILNTVLFIKALVHDFNVMDILPLLVIAQFPTLWFLLCVCIQRSLRRRFHQIFIGFILNKLVSPFISPIVFAAVITNLGKAVWGISGITATSTGNLLKPSTDALLVSSANSHQTSSIYTNSHQASSIYTMKQKSEAEL